MSKPNAEHFAKIVLWQLAAIRAEQSQLRHQYLGQMATVTGIPEKEIKEKWERQHKELRDKIYRMSLDEAGLDGESEPPTFRR